MTLLILIFLAVYIGSYLKRKKYNNSNYKKESGNEYRNAIGDKGNYGEYLTFNKLEKISGCHKILTNVYLPKGNGETTEVDLIYIHETGIYVLESKNFSGWIFGDEKSKYWMQTFKNGKKEKFYNPIWQNNTHIKYLTKLLQIDGKYIKSIIVFSERCTIKKIEVHSENVKVINRYNLNKTMEGLIHNSPNIFPMGKIIELYSDLKPYTCVSKEAKLKHADEVNLNRNSRTENIKFEKQDKTYESCLNENNFVCQEQNENNLIYQELNDKSPIYRELKEYRLNKSRKENIKAYAIYSNSELEEIIKKKPKTVGELRLINGFGNFRCNKYGEDIINIVKIYCE